MTEQNNSVCAICGKSYHLCLVCDKTRKLSPWKIHTDTSEHYKIYQILHGYSTGVYSKDEAKNKLKTVDLSDLESFREHIKTRIKFILKEEIVDEAKNGIEEDVVSENKITDQAKIVRKKKNNKEKSVEQKDDTVPL